MVKARENFGLCMDHLRGKRRCVCGGGGGRVYWPLLQLLVGGGGVAASSSSAYATVKSMRILI